MGGSAFEYVLKESARAKNVRLRITTEHGLEVVVPRGFDTARVPVLLETKRSWIERSLKKTAARRDLHAAQLAAGPPAQLQLAAVGEEWAVEYQPTSAKRVLTRAIDDRRLVVYGAVGDEEVTRAALRRWLARRAGATLIPRLDGLANRHGFDVDAVTIRWQRSRWGSCSPSGRISLNAQLLFLPSELADHVLVHELCHTVQLDHSREFWSLLERTTPGHVALKRRLRDAGWMHVPAWLRAL